MNNRVRDFQRGFIELKFESIFIIFSKFHTGLLFEIKVKYIFLNVKFFLVLCFNKKNIFKNVAVIKTI